VTNHDTGCVAQSPAHGGLLPLPSNMRNKTEKDTIDTKLTQIADYSGQHIPEVMRNTETKYSHFVLMF
jgi:hypothetical protein